MQCTPTLFILKTLLIDSVDKKKVLIHQDQGFAAMVYDLDKSIGGLLMMSMMNSI